jgi:hypothetical protein
VLNTSIDNSRTVRPEMGGSNPLDFLQRVKVCQTCQRTGVKNNEGVNALGGMVAAIICNVSSGSTGAARFFFST